MRKALTEIHLLMEKKGFNHLKDIALELAEFYGYKTKVKIKRGRYEGEKGFYHWHDNTIHIDPNQSPKEFIITCLHEIYHVIQTAKAGGPRQMQKIAEREWEKAAIGEYGKRAEKNPYEYVPFEIEAEKWAQNEYRKKWKNTYSKDNF
tara:strand:+ start:490 stop:933 length:444 start_codon:yes stop_codon:yes gene_type:complete